MTDHHDLEVKSDSNQAETVDAVVRREILTKMGRFAYAAPALSLLAKPRAAQADYGGPRRGGGDKGAGVKGRG